MSLRLADTLRRPVGGSLAAPTILGALTLGSVLTLQNNAPGTVIVSAQWTRDGVAISGATATTYTVQNVDLNHSISCTVVLGVSSSTGGVIPIGTFVAQGIYDFSDTNNSGYGLFMGGL